MFLFLQAVLIQKLTKGSLVADVLKQYVEGLEELDTHVASRLLTQDVQEEGKHVLLQEEAKTHTHTKSVHTNTCMILFMMT